MSDTVFKGFQCLNPQCQEYLFVRADTISEFFDLECPSCHFHHMTGEETTFYEYDLEHLENKKIIESGEFAILHDDYISEAKEFKYCIICGTLKPLEYFHKHSSRRSGHQGECRLCKTVYNSIKNQTRLVDQHREAAQKRRLYMDLTGSTKIDSSAIYERYEKKCFNCRKDLSRDIQEHTPKEREGNLDHTLPARYLWPLTNANATLLCKDCNAEKAEKWPSEFYSEYKIKQLVTYTGFEYNLLSGHPQFNPDALARLEDSAFVDDLLNKYARYMDEMVRIRNRILESTGPDMFAVSRRISQTWIETANSRRKHSS